jgi:hypothetical protein
MRCCVLRRCGFGRPCPCPSLALAPPCPMPPYHTISTPLVLVFVIIRHYFTYTGSPNGPIQRPKPVRYVQCECYETTARSEARKLARVRPARCPPHGEYGLKSGENGHLARANGAIDGPYCSPTWSSVFGRRCEPLAGRGGGFGGGAAPAPTCGAWGASSIRVP